ncbi:MAG TPA: DUF2079 domain-containing protein [Candidatus Dormibacteraeota bacterium]
MASAAAAGLWYGWLLLRRDASLTTFGYDQAFFQQVVWNLDHGRWFVSSFNQGSFLGLHFEPLLVLPAALELAWPDPRVLSLLAAAALAGLVPSTFLFLRALSGRAGLAAALAIPLPLWPAVQESTRANFHPETIGICAALLAGWAGLGGRTAVCWTLALVAVSAKEDQAWTVLVVGLALAVVPASRRLGRRLAAFGLGYGVLIAGVVMPILRHGHYVDTDTYYRWLASASPASLLHALSFPAGWLAALVMVACAGGLPLLRPVWLLLALPPLAADLLSAHGPQPFLQLQYALPLLVPILTAAGQALRGLPEQVTAPGLALTPVLALAPALLGLTLGSLPPGPANPDPAAFQRPPALARLQACTSLLPAAAPVAADDPLTPRLASRPSIRELTGAQEDDYLVIDRQAVLPAYVKIAERDRVLAEAGRPLLCDDGRFRVLGPVRTAAPPSSPGPAARPG